MEVAQSSFRRTIINGLATCGGPCFYTTSMCYVWKTLPELIGEIFGSEGVKNTRLVWHMKKFRRVFSKYFNQLLEYEYNEYDLDLDSGHLFHDNETECVCGLFSSTQRSNSMRLDDESSFELSNFSSKIFLNSTIERKKTTNLKLIDCFDSKLNALSVTRDILATLLNIGVFIHD